jgi:peptidoglycan/xylan/chitin deacetylase (PgdA/CDA1 family)
VTQRFRPLVLCYHAVSDGWTHGLSVGPRQLERQLRLMVRRGYRGGGVEETLDGRRRILHATFDDAYRSVASALPILERLRVPASVYACTGYADGGRALSIPELAAEAAAYPSELATMDWAALREVVERGVEVGSHTVSHPHLTRLSDGELEAELRDSRARLEAELARPCRFLAYPYGENDGRVREAARRAGYEAAFALRERFDGADPFGLPRVDFYRKDTPLRAMLKTRLVPRLPPGVFGVLGALRRGRRRRQIARP